MTPVFPIEHFRILRARIDDDLLSILDQQLKELVETLSLPLSTLDNSLPSKVTKTLYNFLNETHIELLLDDILDQAQGVDLLDYALGIVQPQLIEKTLMTKAADMITFFSPIIKKRKIIISSAKLPRIDPELALPEGHLDLEPHREEIEENYHNDVVERPGFQKVRDYIERHPNHPLTLAIQALIGQSRFHIGNSATCLTAELFDKLGLLDKRRQRPEISNATATCFISETNFGVDLLFQTDIYLDEQRVVTGSFSYSLIMMENPQRPICGHPGHFIFVTNSHPFWEAYNFGRSYQKNPFPLEPENSMFLTTLEEKIYLDKLISEGYTILEQWASTNQQNRIAALETIETQPFSFPILAILNSIKKNSSERSIKRHRFKQIDYLSNLFQYLHGVDYLDYTLGKICARFPEHTPLLIKNFFHIIQQEKIILQDASDICPEEPPLDKTFPTTWEGKDIEHVNKKYSIDENRNIDFHWCYDQLMQDKGNRDVFSMPIKALLAQTKWQISFSPYYLATQMLTIYAKYMNKEMFHLFSPFMRTTVTPIPNNGYLLFVRHDHIDKNFDDNAIEQIYLRSSIVFKVTRDENGQSNGQLINIFYVTNSPEIKVALSHFNFNAMTMLSPAKKQEVVRRDTESEAYKQALVEHLDELFRLTTFDDIAWKDFFYDVYTHIQLTVRPLLLNYIDQSEIHSKEGALTDLLKAQLDEFTINRFLSEKIKIFAENLTPRLQILFYQLANLNMRENSNNTLNTLVSPTLSGNRLTRLTEQQQWKKLTQKLKLKRLPNKTKVHDFSLRHPVLVDGEDAYCLKTNAIDWLFDIAGNPRTIGTPIPLDTKCDYPATAHHTPQFTACFFPKKPGISIAVRQLASRIISEGIVETKTVLIIYKGNYYPVEINNHIAGVSLTEASKTHKKLTNIDKKNFTRLLLFTLLIALQNNDPEQIILDIDHCLYFTDSTNSILENNGAHVFINNILFCLEQMHENLDAGVIQDFISLDKFDVIQAWLNDLMMVNEHFFNTFGDSSVQFFDAYQKIKSSLLAITFSPQIIENLIQRFDDLQSVLKNAPRKITGIELLRRAFPSLYQAYIPLLNQSMAPLMRFSHIVSPNAIPEITQDKKQSPKQMLETLKRLEKKQVTNNSDLETILNELMQGDTKNFLVLPMKRRAQIVKIFHLRLETEEIAFSETVMTNILDALSTVELDNVSLRYYAPIIDNARLKKVFQLHGQSYRELDLSGCHVTDLTLLPHYCPNLTTLKIENVLTLTDIDDTNVSFPELTTCSLRGCTNLANVRLVQSPKLSKLDLDHCNRLETLVICNEQSIQLSGIQTCLSLPYKKLFYKYPFLARYDFSRFQADFPNQLFNFLENLFAHYATQYLELPEYLKQALEKKIAIWISLVLETQQENLGTVPQALSTNTRSYIIPSSPLLKTLACIHTQDDIEVHLPQLKEMLKNDRSAIELLTTFVEQNAAVFVPLLIRLTTENHDGTAHSLPCFYWEDRAVQQIAEKTLLFASKLQPESVISQLFSQLENIDQSFQNDRAIPVDPNCYTNVLKTLMMNARHHSLIRNLVMIGSRYPDKVIYSIIKQLESKIPETLIANYVGVLGAIGNTHSETICPMLVQLFPQVKNHYTKLMIIEALHIMPDASSAVVRMLLQFLRSIDQSKDHSSVEIVVRTLKIIGKKYSDRIEAAIRSLGLNLALWNMGPRFREDDNGKLGKSHRNAMVLQILRKDGEAIHALHHITQIRLPELLEKVRPGNPLEQLHCITLPSNVCYIFDLAFIQKLISLIQNGSTEMQELATGKLLQYLSDERYQDYHDDIMNALLNVQPTIPLTFECFANWNDLKRQIENLIQFAQTRHIVQSQNHQTTTLAHTTHFNKISRHPQKTHNDAGLPHDLSEKAASYSRNQ